MIIKTPKKEYPYAMKCVACGHIEAFFKERPAHGESLSLVGAVLASGELPINGTRLLCDCIQKGDLPVWELITR